MSDGVIASQKATRRALAAIAIVVAVVVMLFVLLSDTTTTLRRDVRYPKHPRDFVPHDLTARQVSLLIRELQAKEAWFHGLSKSTQKSHFSSSEVISPTLSRDELREIIHGLTRATKQERDALLIELDTRTILHIDSEGEILLGERCKTDEASPIELIMGARRRALVLPFHEGSPPSSIALYCKAIRTGWRDAIWELVNEPGAAGRSKLSSASPTPRPSSSDEAIERFFVHMVRGDTGLAASTLRRTLDLFESPERSEILALSQALGPLAELAAEPANRQALSRNVRSFPGQVRGKPESIYGPPEAYRIVHEMREAGLRSALDWNDTERLRGGRSILRPIKEGQSRKWDDNRQSQRESLLHARRFAAMQLHDDADALFRLTVEASDDPSPPCEWGLALAERGSESARLAVETFATAFGRDPLFTTAFVLLHVPTVSFDLTLESLDERLVHALLRRDFEEAFSTLGKLQQDETEVLARTRLELARKLIDAWK